MKLIHTLVGTALAALIFSSTAQAMPPGRGGIYYPTLAKKSDFENAKPGEKLVLICKNSESIKGIDVRDGKRTIEFCAERKMLYCPKCKREYKVTWNLPISKGGPPMYAIKIMNEHGKSCIFFPNLK
jgi:uncharacterized protein YbaR (Trm112 family)